jgi:hypothetical protein
MPDRHAAVFCRDNRVVRSFKAPTRQSRATLATNVVRYVIGPRRPRRMGTLSVCNLPTAARSLSRCRRRGGIREAQNPLWLPNSLRDAAKAAALSELRSSYNAAARAVRNELPLAGSFGPGQGDPRLTWENKASAATLWSEASAGLSDHLSSASHPPVFPPAASGPYGRL